MSDVVYVAIVAATSSLLSALLLAWVGFYISRANKVLDWKRQDEVANLAAEASQRMLAKQDATRAAMEEGTRASAISREETNAGLAALHTQGNSQLTAANTSELNSTMRELASLREIMALKVASGIEPSVESLVVIETAERRIAELRGILATRRRTDELAMAQIEEGQTSGKMAAAAAVAAKPAAEEAARKVVPPVVTEVVPPVVKAAVKEALDEHDKGTK